MIKPTLKRIENGVRVRWNFYKERQVPDKRGGRMRTIKKYKPIGGTDTILRGIITLQDIENTRPSLINK